MKARLEERLKNKNTEKVWNALLPACGLTYEELMNKTGLARSTLYNALERLEEEYFLERRMVRKKTSRKPYTEWWLTTDGLVLKREEINGLLWRDNVVPRGSIHGTVSPRSDIDVP